MPQEERTIEARFGEAYLEYKNKVARWFGKIRRYFLGDTGIERPLR